MNEVRRERVLYVLRHYPQISETYIQVEIDALRPDHDIRIVATRVPDVAYRRHDPFELVAGDDFERMLAIVDEFRPTVLHGHWLQVGPLVGELSKRSGLPFTMRAHSFDVLGKDERSILQRLGGTRPGPTFLRDAVPHYLSGRCLGVVSFPFGRDRLRRAGLPDALIHDAPPCFSFARFHDTSANGEAVMNGGSAQPKKQMEDFLDLALRLPATRFDLYPVGRGSDPLIEKNRARGDPVRITPNVEPDEMPRLYKQHRWLVYTASTAITTTGWPVMIAEAQAAGVGVLMRNIRPDMAEWVGPCGYLYDDLDEAARIIAQPFPEEKRQAGFAQASGRDIQIHKRVLTDLWASASP